jgi:hypothetical protein
VKQRGPLLVPQGRAHFGEQAQIEQIVDVVAQRGEVVLGELIELPPGFSFVSRFGVRTSQEAAPDGIR